MESLERQGGLKSGHERADGGGEEDVNLGVSDGYNYCKEEALSHLCFMT